MAHMQGAHSSGAGPFGHMNYIENFGDPGIAADTRSVVDCNREFRQGKSIVLDSHPFDTVFV
jgi:hypothetical protein